jgi:hypothetical protein
MNIVQLPFIDITPWHCYLRVNRSFGQVFYTAPKPNPESWQNRHQSQQKLINLMADVCSFSQQAAGFYQIIGMRSTL